MPFLSALQRRLPWIAGTGLAATLASGLLLPIYTDEVGWRMQLHRSPFDGGVDRDLADQCGSSTDVAAPWFMQPLRHLTALIDAAVADPRMVRLLGVAFAFLVAALFALLARSVDRGRSATILAIAYALLGLGTLPLLLVWHRPEQPILVAILAAVLIALKVPAGRGAAAGATLALLALGTLLVGEHPKGVVFAPILLVALVLAGRGTTLLPLRIGAALCLLLLALAAFRYWQQRFACPGDPVIAAHNAAENVFAANQGRGVGALLRAMLSQASPTQYLPQITPARARMSAWLPEVPVAPALGTLWINAGRAAWKIAMLGGVLAAAVRVAKLRRGERPDRAFLLAFTLLGCCLAWGALQINKNDYESALVLPLLALALMLVLPPLLERWPRAAAAWALLLCVTATASEAALLLTYAPPLARTAWRGGYIADQPFSFTPWRYPAMCRQIVAAARLCGIGRSGARYLLVDDLTYWPFVRSYRPFNRMAVLEPWIPTSRDPLGYLRAHGSSGGVTQCAVLPPALRARAHAAGDFCCVGPL